MRLIHRIDPRWPELYLASDPVTNIAQQVLPEIGQLRHIMDSHLGVSIAAPQVGIRLRFFIWGNGRRFPQMVVVNPQITWRSEDIRKDSEGCLSRPGFRFVVSRPESIRATFTDLKGIKYENVLLSGFRARVFQHEFDHLNGVCIWQKELATVEPIAPQAEGAA